MDKTCIINPVTGRAVKIDSRLGKKLYDEKKKKEDNAVKKLQGAVRRATTKKPQETKTIEIETKTKKPRGSGGNGRKKKEPVSVVKSADDKSDAIKKLQAAVKRQYATKKYDKEKDFRKAMGDDFSKQKFGKMTEKEKKESMEKNKKMMEEQNKKLVGDKTAKDVFKIIKDYLDVWSFENYKKSKMDKKKYLIKHQDAWVDVAEIVDAYGKEKLLKTLNEKDKKIFEEYKQQAKLEGSLEQKIILD